MTTTNAPTEPTPPSPRRHRVVRALINLVCLTLAWPAYPQASSTLLQSPPFTATEPPGNVFVMLDDSASMGGHTLPVPTGITISAAGPTVVIQGDGANTTGAWALRSWTINRDHDWILRSPALNPLWYNPAVLYRPWNKDGTPLPDASIGGSTPGTHWGAFTSRADPAQLTERDPRQAPSGTGYASVTAGAGRGLLGTDPSDPTSNLLTGRRVNVASPSVDFRYYKMPFDFGPTKLGATTPPGNGHASYLWTTHNGTSSPLDLFSRPLMATTATTQSGCFTGIAQCQSGAPPATRLLTTTWQRTNCAGQVETFASNPGPLTCHRARCGVGAWSAWSPTPVTLPCGFQWIDCNGVVRTSATNPGPISCGWRRQDCAGNFQTFGANPGPLVCYRSRACDGTAWSGWSTTNPGTPTACFTRQNCSGTTQYFSGADPGPLACSWSRQDCSGATQTFASDPGSLTCWQRTRCVGSGTDTFATEPSPLSVACRYERQNCTGTVQQFPPSPDPGSLTCYQRQNCDGSTMGPTTSLLSPVTCAGVGELPITYNPTSFVRNSTLVQQTATTFTRTASGGGTRNSTAYPRVDTTTRLALPPITITPIATGQTSETTTYNATSNTVASCPVGTSQLSCTVTPAAGAPDPELLTPARYYMYTGSGSKGDPANYRVVQIDRTRPAGYLFPVVDAATGQAVSAADSQRTDCAANGKTLCTWAEEARNFANWWLYYRNRLFAAQAVMSEAMASMTTSSQQQLRLAYGRINYFPGSINPWRTVPVEPIASLPPVDGFTNPGGLVRGARPFVAGSPARAAFFDWLFSLSWVGATPNREAIDSMGRYFSWADSRGPWGATPGTADSAPQLACRRNFAFLTTDGEWTNVTAGQPLLGPTGPLAGPGSPVEADNVSGPPTTGDGTNAGARFTYAPGDWPALTGGTGQSGTLTDVATYYWNRDLRPDLPNVIRPITDSARPNPAFWQSMSTYIVGYGLSASMDTEATRTAFSNGSPVTWPTVDLTPTTITGGNRVNDSLRAALASRGDFYAASDTASLKNAILNALREMVTTMRGSAGGVAVTGAGITGSSQAFFPSYVTGKWTGSLRAFASTDLEALATGNAVMPAWSASVPSAATRKMLTSTARNSATTFSAANLSAAQVASLTGPGYTAAEIVAYVRGDQSLELSETGPPAGRKFRRRESLLGDFVNSTPLYVKAPDYGYSVMPTIGSAYASFVSSRRAGTTATVFIGGNAGAFHAFDAATGVERFSYVPRGVYPDLPRLADPGYSHRYFVDGPVTGGDWHDGSAWRSIVVGTTGAGGGSIFAIDVTDPAAVSQSSVRWDVTKDESPHIGNVLSRGVIGHIPNGSGGHRWVYIVGNGYESASNRAALLVIDIATGAVDAVPVGPTWTVAAGLGARNGMGGVTVSYNAQRGVKEVYAGDRQGNLWRFDFSNGVPTGAKGFDGGNTPLFVATDAGGNRRPITAAPRLALHPLSGLYLIFGTGKLHDEGDSFSTDAQAIYGLWLKPDQTSAITGSSIATIPVTSADGVRRYSLNAIDWATKRGWQVQLTGGERVISDPSADLGTMVVASFKPGSGGDPCDGGGSSYLYRIIYATGEVVGIPAASGVVGAITPLVALPGRSRTLSSTSLPRLFERRPDDSTGGAVSSTAQCKLYSTSIQGRPNVIAQNCPGLSPVRMWRQPTR